MDSYTRFNPRPPSLAGDPRWVAEWAGVPDVSIRARHHWRAIPVKTRALLSKFDVSIRARHHWRAIPIDLTRSDLPDIVSIRARHHWRAIPQSGRGVYSYSAGFNPRPPSLAGDPAPTPT